MKFDKITIFPYEILRNPFKIPPQERNFALANCVFDSVAATTWMMRALLSIEEASRNCPEPKACTVDVLYVPGPWWDGW